jgi:hypothetical protein
MSQAPRTRLLGFVRASEQERAGIIGICNLQDPAMTELFTDPEADIPARLSFAEILIANMQEKGELPS